MYKTKSFHREATKTVKPTWGNLQLLLTKFGLFVLNCLGKRAKRHHAKLFNSVGTYFRNTLVNEGLDTMINKMKVSVISIQKWLAGQPLNDTRPLGAWVKLANGLPAFLPREIRSAIRQKSIPILRLVISILSMYRGFEGAYGLPSYDSIQSPKSERNFRDLHEWFDAFCWKGRGIVKDGYIRAFGMRVADIEFVPILSSSPNHKSSYSGILRDAQLWKALGQVSIMWEYLSSIIHLYPSVPRVLNSFLVLSEYRAVSYSRSLPLPVVKTKGRSERETSKRPHGLGRISLKYEPAGKIRPFAIVDYWTQIVLKPLHEAVMKFIIDHFSPMDATYDQSAAVKSFAEEGHENIYSFDLSKATDMIPIQAYVEVLSVLVTRRMANAWVSLMVARGFLTTEKGKVTGEVKYTRGQPMGAFSSWALLALFHHLVVQFSAWKVTGKFDIFKAYRVLGDDIVIGDLSVATEYLRTMEDFGVPISLPKSFISEKKPSLNSKAVEYPLFNFANQIWLGTTNISPLPYAEFTVASQKGLTALKEVAYRLIRYNWVGSGGSRMRLLTWNASEWKRIQVYFNKSGTIESPFVLKLLAYAYQAGSDLFMYQTDLTMPNEVPSCGRLLSVCKHRKVSSLKGSVEVVVSDIVDLAVSLGTRLHNSLSHSQAKALLWTEEFNRMNFCVNLSKELIPARGWVGYKSDISDLTAQLDCFYDIQSDVWKTFQLPARVLAAGTLKLALNNFIGLKSTPHVLLALERLLELNRSHNPPKKLVRLSDVDALVRAEKKPLRTGMAWRMGRFLLKETGFKLLKITSKPSGAKALRLKGPTKKE